MLKINNEFLQALVKKYSIDRIDITEFNSSVQVVSSSSYSQPGKFFYPVSCIIKLFTSCLITELLLKKKIRLNTNAIELLNPELVQYLPYRISKVTIGHLLNHTHGLGGTCNSFHPNSKGYISIQDFLSVIEGESSHFFPGRYFSYNNTGYILLGILLENFYKKRFPDILVDNILIPLTDSRSESKNYIIDRESKVCPSTGEGFRATTTLLAKFLSAYLSSSINSSYMNHGTQKTSFEVATKIPGISFTTQECINGWKKYHNEWYGHDGYWDNHFTAARISRTQRRGVVISACGVNSASCVYEALRKFYPESLPSLQSVFDGIAYGKFKKPNKKTTCYGTNLFRYKISESDINKTVKIITRTSPEHEFTLIHESDLTITNNNIYLLKNPWNNVRLLQRITGITDFLWDHCQLWPSINT